MSELLCVLAADLDFSGKSWVDVMPTCTEARNGRFFFTVTRPDLEVFAASIAANPGRIPVDYDHDGARDGGSTKAAGWFTGQTVVRDGVLRAEVEWTPAAQVAIRSGEYRFLSPEFSFEDRDAKTGLMTRAKRLLAATLTNRPFFNDMAAVTATNLRSEMLTHEQRVVLAREHFDKIDKSGRGLRAPEEQVEAHVRAEEILAARGRHEYTSEEYIAAYAQAESELEHRVAS